MPELSWGKPRIKIGKLAANGATPSSWIELPTPIENTTKLTVQKGEKKEAKIEGGENEAVKYSANIYALELEIRSAKGRAKPVEDTDGIIEGEYAVILQPENPTAEGLQIDRCVVSVEDSYDGERIRYIFNVLKPNVGSQVKYKHININDPLI